MAWVWSWMSYLDDLIMYAKTTWEWVVKQVKINIFSDEAQLQGFD